MEQISSQIRFYESPKLRLEDVLGTKAKYKILTYLIRVPGMEANISSIVNATKLNHITASADLEYLEKIGFVQRKEFGRIKIYRFRDENQRAAALIHLIAFWEGGN
jgi:Fic family protein